jgi:hypothetical protein
MEVVFRHEIVMIYMLASSAVDRGFESWSGQAKHYGIGIGFLSVENKE